MSSKFTGFKYTGGDRSLSLPGVPARNITHEEAKEQGYSKKELLASGIYEEVLPPDDEKKKNPKPEVTNNG